MITNFKKIAKFRIKKKEQIYYKNHNKFSVAFKGIYTVFAEESSFRYQTLIFALVLVMGIALDLNQVEWISIIIVSIIVLSLEIMNTAVENIIDIISPEYNKSAGKVKDIAAGCVLLASIGAVCIGIFIFYPKIITLI
ncbi:diacylglycerol kinase family protein [Mycoplasma sp. P36-A1]|uniref:diacylglycerol kinase family protein n=1 Tax=Mycoplasma sp. P36-A1 TaxID=3252900 RepID=UPI003C2BD9B6